jgi:hypothetical protein
MDVQDRDPENLIILVGLGASETNKSSCIPRPACGSSRPTNAGSRNKPSETGFARSDVSLVQKYLNLRDDRQADIRNITQQDSTLINSYMANAWRGRSIDFQNTHAKSKTYASVRIYYNPVEMMKGAMKPDRDGLTTVSSIPYKT